MKVLRVSIAMLSFATSAFFTTIEVIAEDNNTFNGIEVVDVEQYDINMALD